MKITDKFSSEDFTDIVNIQTTISSQGLTLLQKERRAYYIVLIFALIIGTADEKALIVATSTFYIAMVGFFTVNKYLRDHPQVVLNSIFDFIRLNPVNYIFLIISIFNWWNDIFLEQEYQNLLLVLYGIFVFEMMMLSSLLYFQLVKTNGNLELMSPRKDLFLNKRAIQLAFGGALVLGIGQAVFVGLLVTVIPNFLLVGLSLGITVVFLSLYYIVKKKGFIPYSVDRDAIDRSFRGTRQSEDEKISISREINAKKTIIQIILVLFVIISIVLAVYSYQSNIPLAAIYLVLLVSCFGMLIRQYVEYRELKRQLELYESTDQSEQTN